MRTKYTEDFEMFWKLYPYRWDRNAGERIKRKKAPAFEKWQKLSNEIKAECLMNAKKIRASEGSCPRDCVTWINQKGWEEMRPKKKEAMPTNEEIKAMAEKLANKWTEKPKKKSEVWKMRKELLSDN